MEQITIQINNMNDVKREIDNCQRKAMTSVVELGYILRKADDAEIFKEAGYSSIFKFAEAEYGWSQSQTSRFMDINREFSENGYSTVLRQQYEGFGQAKLAEMLTLPEPIREELSPDMKRDEIREIKREERVAEEENKKNIFANTVMLDGDTEDILREVLKALLLDEKIKERFKEIYSAMSNYAVGIEQSEESIRISMCGNGFGFTRAAAYMVFWKKDMVNVVQGSKKQSFSYNELLEGLINIKGTDCSVVDWYRDVTGEELYPKKEEPKPAKEITTVAPAQKKEQPKPQSHIETSAQEEDSQLEGQTEIEQFAEPMPIQYEKDEETEENAPIVEENVDKTEVIEQVEQEVVEKQSENPQVENASYMQSDNIERDLTCDGKCEFCDGEVKSNDGTFKMILSGNGLARIEREEDYGIFEFKYCPGCGKELCNE